MDMNENENVPVANNVKADEFVISSGDEDEPKLGRKVTDGKGINDGDGLSELDDIPNYIDNEQKEPAGENGGRVGLGVSLEGGGIEQDSDVGVIDEDGYVTFDYGMRNDEFVVLSDNDEDYHKDRKITLGDKKDIV